MSQATTQNVRFTMTRTSAPAATDPDFEVYRAGALIASGTSGLPDSEVSTISLTAGEYFIDARDFVNVDTGSAGHDSCFTFKAEAG